MTPPPPIPPPAGRIAGWAVLLLAAAAGCEGGTGTAALRAQIRALQDDNTRLQEQLLRQRRLVEDQRRQIRTLQGLGRKRLERLFHVSRIELGRYTGGVDLDGRPGHDGIRVYLLPKDQYGHTLKAAGDVKIQLFDLAEPAAGNLLATYEFTPDAIARNWHSGFATYHFRFDCPWKSAPPRHAEITVRVTFTDYLTGKPFTVQKLVKINPPPTTAPAR